MTRATFLLADGPFIDRSVVDPHAAAAGVALRCAPLETADDVARESAGADGVLVVTNPLTRELIEALAPGVKVIGRAGVGLDAIDLQAAQERGVAVFHTPDYCVGEVATHTLALALALNRRLLGGDALVRREWGAWRSLAPVAPLHEQTVGVVGLGRIGRAVAERFAVVAGRVVGFDPWLADEAPGVERVGDLSDLLAQADVVTLHVPLTAETEHVIDAAALAAMKQGALLVNVSRGGLVDEAALAAALRDGVIAGAGLDVFAQEPPSPDHPLLSAPNVVLSPHFAWYSSGSQERVWSSTIDGMLALLHGVEPTSGRVAVPGALVGGARA